MRFGQKPPKIWHPSSELDNKFSSVNVKLNRLMVLDHVWTRLVGDKAKFWVLDGVKGSVLYVSVKAAVAKNELIGRRAGLVAELNKHFDRPWISRIEINQRSVSK